MVMAARFVYSSASRSLPRSSERRENVARAQRYALVLS